MNTRPSIQPSAECPVLSIAFSNSYQRFITSLSDGFRVFRTDNCLVTNGTGFDITTGINTSIAVSAVLDDRYIAYVPRGKTDSGSGHIVIFWDCTLNQEVCRFDLHEPILGLRLSRKWMVVILQQRTIVFAYYQFAPPQQPTPPLDEGAEADRGLDPDQNTQGPGYVHAIYPTASNPFALASLRNDTLVLPAQSLGQVQVIPVAGGSKRVIRAHSSQLRQLCLSPDGSLLATASEQGTLMRVWDTRTTDQVAEFRRGVEKVTVFSLAISPGNRWLASTSDKGTLHVYDIRPPLASEVAAPHKHEKPSQTRKPPSYATHRLSAGAIEKESLSAFSGRSAPASAISTALPAGAAYQGSVQEYYGLRPPPTNTAATGRETAVSAMSALRAAPWAPKVLKDIRSVASAAFWTGNDGPHWQLGRTGSTAFQWTTTPNGTRKRVKVPVPPLPNDPSGRPPKGIVTFASDSSSGESEDDGMVLYVIGGGAEGRWEAFDLIPIPASPGGGEAGWALVKRGFRRFLSRQFVD